MCEILRDRQVALCANKQACGLRLAICDPEYLGKCDGLFVSAVAKDAENHGVGVVVAEGYRFGNTCHFTSLRLVIPEHIGSERALPGVSAGSLVVGDPVRRHQQGRYGVDQGRFTGADIAGKKRVLTIWS